MGENPAWKDHHSAVWLNNKLKRAQGVQDFSQWVEVLLMER